MTDQMTFNPTRWREQLPQLGKGGWLLLLGLVGVVLLVWGSLWPAPAGVPATSRPALGPAGAPAPGGEAGWEAAGGAGGYAAQVEAVLAETLSQVAGAGQVSVRVFLDSGPRYEYARKTADDTRTTQESDRSGTSRITSERREEGEVTVRRGGSGGEDVPVVVMTHLPAVRGVLVVAGGAADPTVRAELSRAVQTALGLPPHRVTVLAKEAEE